MPAYICVTCGVQHADRQIPPPAVRRLLAALGLAPEPPGRPAPAA